MQQLGLRILLAVFSQALSGSAAPDDAFAKWEPAIAAFEKQFQADPPPPGAVLFVGSSSIRRWDLEEWFPERATINRGFGGSQIVDSTHFAGRIIVPCRPGAIVLYAGDNDLAAKKSPEKVGDDFAAFVRRVRADLPETPILFLAIKPSLARWKLIEKIRKANRLIRAQCERLEDVEYVDVFTPMLGDDGRPRRELLADDGLHLSPAGYELWAEVVAETLPAQPARR